MFIQLNYRSIDLTNKTFGKLTAIGPVHKNKNNRIVWLCSCSCGNNCTAVSSDLIHGDTKSCGCSSSRSTIGVRSTTHELGGTPEHYAWSGMKSRCNNPNNPKYKSYNGRGISVCSRWATFENFLSDMGKKPSPSHSIDRINNDGPYSPENCRWASPRQQSNNTRKNVTITHNNETLTIAQWARKTGLRYATLRDRIYKNHWAIEKALTTPTQTKYQHTNLGL